jgi:hypothetical protein
VGYDPLDAGSDPLSLPASGRTGLTPSLVSSPISSLKYSPDQPRVPSGNSDGGQWTDGGGGGAQDSRSDRTVVAGGNNGPRILGRAAKDFGQRVNKPSPKDVNVRMGHILESHTATGSSYTTSIRHGGSKTKFPDRMTPKDVEKAVREAYSNAREVSSPQYNPDGKIRLLEGKSNGLTIRMYYNATTKTMDSAFPRK